MILRNSLAVRTVSSDRKWPLAGGRERAWDRKREKTVLAFVDVSQRWEWTVQPQNVTGVPSSPGGGTLAPPPTRKDTWPEESLTRLGHHNKQQLKGLKEVRVSQERHSQDQATCPSLDR